jgi:hypothetical protein
MKSQTAVSLSDVAVFVIIDDRMPLLKQVNPDLVFLSRQQVYLKQTVFI